MNPLMQMLQQTQNNRQVAQQRQNNILNTPGLRALADERTKNMLWYRRTGDKKALAKGQEASKLLDLELQKLGTPQAPSSLPRTQQLGF